MTPVDKALDLSHLIKESPLTLYRLTARKYATSLSGLGAAMYPGRWNFPGEEAIYTSTQIGTCVLERLVHTPKNCIPNDLALMTIHLKGTWIWRPMGEGVLGKEASTNAQLYSCLTLKGANSYRRVATSHINIADNPLIALAAPSVVVPVWNVVLYPRARSFWDHVSLMSVEPFDYDPRLFPDQTPVNP